jgi:hypothetical protein
MVRENFNTCLRDVGQNFIVISFGLVVVHRNRLDRA